MLKINGKAQRLLDQVNAATMVETLRVPPSNKLAKLTDDLPSALEISDFESGFRKKREEAATRKGISIGQCAISKF